MIVIIHISLTTKTCRRMTQKARVEAWRLLVLERLLDSISNSNNNSSTSSCNSHQRRMSIRINHRRPNSIQVWVWVIVSRRPLRLCKYPPLRRRCVMVATTRCLYDRRVLTKTVLLTFEIRKTSRIYIYLIKFTRKTLRNYFL